MYIISIYKINLYLPRGEFFNKLDNLFRKQVSSPKRSQKNHSLNGFLNYVVKDLSTVSNRQ